MFFKPEDLYAAGQAGGDLVKGLASEIANQVCGLYQDFPRSFGVDSPAKSTLGALTSGVFDSFCGRLPEPKLPPAPAVPFQGGQCNCVSYTIDLSVEIRNRSTNSLVDTRVTSLQMVGPITGIAIEDPSPSGADSVAVVARGSFGNCQPGATALTSAARELFTMTNLQILSITRDDGLPDDCGSLSPSYPPSSAPASNPRSYNHTGNDGIARPINFNIDFPDVGISPTINFPDLPGLSIPVKIDATGIEVNIPIGISNNNGDLSDDNLEDLLAGAKAASRAARAGNRATDGGTDNEGGDGEDGIEGLYGVFFDATVIPPWFGKTFGNPTKYRLGRISFRREGYNVKDEDILFSKQYFPAPSDADGYVAYYEPEVTGRITVIREAGE